MSHEEWFLQVMKPVIVQHYVKWFMRGITIGIVLGGVTSALSIWAGIHWGLIGR